MSNNVYVLAGSNLEDRYEILTKSKDRISEAIGPIEASSQIYETEPWGMHNQPLFLNQAFHLKTSLGPFETLKRALRIQYVFKSDKKDKYGPRLLDIDILLYDQLIIDDPHLVVPHPRMHERNFVLIPLAEIAGTVVHPGFLKTISELRDLCTDSRDVRIFNHS